MFIKELWIPNKKARNVYGMKLNRRILGSFWNVCQMSKLEWAASIAFRKLLLYLQWFSLDGVRRTSFKTNFSLPLNIKTSTAMSIWFEFHCLVAVISKLQMIMYIMNKIWPINLFHWGYLYLLWYIHFSFIKSRIN